MHIKKLKHCCMVIDVKTSEGVRRIVTDPGIYSLEEHDKITHADIILITHEHQDHFHVESLKALKKRAPEAIIVTDIGVGAILVKEGIEHRVMEYGNSVELKGVRIEAYGSKHAMFHSSIPQGSNVGFFIENKLFFPGDAFTDPNKSVDVLALPVAGPWMKMSEAVDYALSLKPRISFPVHEGIVGSAMNPFFEKILGKNGIEFVKLEDGGELDIK